MRLVDRSVAVLAAGGPEPVFVVVGAAAVGHVDALVVHNDQWRTGMGSSLRAGLAAISTYDRTVAPRDAVVILLVDHVEVAPECVGRVMAATAAGARVAVATYDGVRGHPVVLRRDDWPEVISSAQGDSGARDFLTRHAETVVEVPCEDIGSNADVDTPADLAAARALH